MANARRSYGPADEIALTTQVGGYCPLCGRKLFYTKRSRSQKAYELAHVYPLNPRLEELEELKGVSLLHSDLNHPDNLIPLCTDCHTRFDKPRTRQEYEVLAEIKRKLIAAVQWDTAPVFEPLKNALMAQNKLLLNGAVQADIANREVTIRSLDLKLARMTTMTTRRSSDPPVPFT